MTTTMPASTSHFFFFNDPATTEIYTLSLHDALPICSPRASRSNATTSMSIASRSSTTTSPSARNRSEEHTSELQSRSDLVCRLLLEKKNQCTSAALADIDASCPSAPAGPDFCFCGPL